MVGMTKLDLRENPGVLDREVLAVLREAAQARCTIILADEAE